MVACDTRSAPPAVAVDVNVACLPADTGTPARSLPTRNLATLRPEMDSLERLLATASDAQTPSLLLALGRAKAQFAPSRVAFGPDRPASDTLYAATRPNEFGYDDSGGEWFYTGVALEELVRRFPSSDQAVDAAYTITELQRGGECEGAIDCAVDWYWRPLARFLRAYPTSSLADSAVKRALAAFRIVDSTADLRLGDEFDTSPTELRREVAELDTIGRMVAPPGRTRLVERAGELWEQFAAFDRARDAYQAALAGADAPSRACLQARLAALPVRTFPLDRTEVVDPHRVTLTWHLPEGGAGELVVYRSDARHARGTPIARVPAADTTCVDRTTQPGHTYWYRVVEPSGGQSTESNPAAAITPTSRLHVTAAAVSVADHRLHVFGALSNNYPQLVQISDDGQTVERSDATVIGPRGQPHALDRYVDDVWLIDGHGQGALDFKKTGVALPPELLTVIRRGAELMPADGKWTGDALLFSVDEAGRRAWFALGGGGFSTALSMDCAPALGLCWYGYEREAALVNETGTIVTRVPLPARAGSDQSYATDIFSNVRDSSAWVYQGRVGHLLHLDRTGAVRQDLVLASGQCCVVINADRERGLLWFTRVVEAPKWHTELAQIDLNAADPQPRVVVPVVPSLPMIVPALSGGVWLVAMDSAYRIDHTGQRLFTVPLNPR